jgi:hypothetical protein
MTAPVTDMFHDFEPIHADDRDALAIAATRITAAVMRGLDFESVHDLYRAIYEFDHRAASATVEDDDLFELAAELVKDEILAAVEHLEATHE